MALISFWVGGGVLPPVVEFFVIVMSMYKEARSVEDKELVKVLSCLENKT